MEKGSGETKKETVTPWTMDLDGSALVPRTPFRSLNPLANCWIPFMSSSYSPVSDAGAPLDDEYLAFCSYSNPDFLSWSPKKDQFQIPRSQPYYHNQPDLKSSAVYIMPRQQDDDGWHHGGRHFQSQIGPYSSSSPRIKQEDISAFPTYPDLLNHPNPISYDFQQHHLQIQTHAHDPNGNTSFQLLSPLQSHQPNPRPTQSTNPPYYSPSFHQQPPAPASASFYPPGTIHPAELSPTDSHPPVSPLSAYADVSGVVAAPPVGMSCDPRLAISGWREDRRDSLASLESELSELGGLMVDVVGPGVAVGGLPLAMDGIPHPHHTMAGGNVEEVGSEEDAEGEEDCQWEQQNNDSQGQFQIISQQQVHYQQQQHQQQQYDEPKVEQHHNDAPRSDHPHPTSEGEDEIDEGADDSARSDISANGRTPASPASASASASTSDEPYEFDDDESDEDYDDPHDDEFVLPSRSNRRRTSSSFPRSGSGSQGTESSGGNAGGEYPGYQYMTSEGRSLRPRSASARYNPYPTSSSFENGFYNQNGQYQQNAQEHHGRRYASSSPSAASGSSSSTTGATTITTTLSSSASSSATASSRRRLRPATSLPIPVPVPNLTKKSRGRRVPTMSSIEDLRSASSGAGKKRQGAPTGKTVRMYLCEVDGCGKCFARGEHLKRHVRSIHTYEKPHRCMYPGCGKDFSRHDNLGQHMRVHKDFVPGQTPVASSSPSSVNGARRRGQPPSE